MGQPRPLIEVQFPLCFQSLPIKSLRALCHLGGADQGLSSSVTSPLTFQLHTHNASQTRTFVMAGRNGSSRKIKSLVREKRLSFISAKVSAALKPLIAEPSHSTSILRYDVGSVFIYLTLPVFHRKYSNTFFYEVGTFGSTAGAFCPVSLLQQAEAK